MSAAETRLLVRDSQPELTIVEERNGPVLLRKIGERVFGLPIKTVFKAEDLANSVHIAFLDCKENSVLRMESARAVGETISQSQIEPYSIFVGLPTHKSQGFGRAAFGEAAGRSNEQGFDFLELDGGKVENCDLDDSLLMGLRKEQETLNESNVVGQVWEGRNKLGETIHVVQYLPITAENGAFKCLMMSSENIGRFMKAMRKRGGIKIIDDVLSRGGTLEAALRLMERALSSFGFSRENIDIHVIAVEGESLPQLGVRRITAETRLPILKGDLSQIIEGNF